MITSSNQQAVFSDCGQVAVPYLCIPSIGRGGGGWRRNVPGGDALEGGVGGGDGMSLVEMDHFISGYSDWMERYARQLVNGRDIHCCVYFHHPSA